MKPLVRYLRSAETPPARRAAQWRAVEARVSVRRGRRRLLATTGAIVQIGLIALLNPWGEERLARFSSSGTEAIGPPALESDASTHSERGLSESSMRAEERSSEGGEGRAAALASGKGPPRKGDDGRTRTGPGRGGLGPDGGSHRAPSADLPRRRTKAVAAAQADRARSKARNARPRLEKETPALSVSGSGLLKKVRADSEQVVFEHMSGVVVISLQGDGRRWIFRCGFAEVEVLGTRFRLERKPGRLLVQVMEGQVAVKRLSDPDAANRVIVSAGARLEVREEETPEAPNARSNQWDRVDALRNRGRSEDAVRVLKRMLEAPESSVEEALIYFTLGQVWGDELNEANKAAAAFRAALSKGGLPSELERIARRRVAAASP